MGFYGDGDSKAFANTENIYGNGKVTKYECIWGFMVTVIARPLLTLKTYMEMGKVTKYECHMGFYGDGDSKAFANIENIYGNGNVTKYECLWGFM